MSMVACGVVRRAGLEVRSSRYYIGGRMMKVRQFDDGVLRKASVLRHGGWRN